MPSFQYRAIQPNGAIAEGELEAGGRQEAFRQMEGRGLRPISLSERRNGKPAKAGSEPAAGPSAPAGKVSFGGAGKKTPPPPPDFNPCFFRFVRGRGALWRAP